MSENKFLERLRGTEAKKSVLEVKNQNTITTFANMPHGTSNPNIAFSDHRGNGVTPLRGTDNWQIDNQSTLVDAGTLYGDGRDITTEFDVSGNTLWINAGYTFTAPKLFTPNTKFVLKLCGHGMFSPVEKYIKFIFLVKFSNGYLITKDVVVGPEAFNFSKEFVIDFDNSEANVIKMVPGDKMTVQLLCADSNAYATIYGGMTVFTALQNRVNSDSVASETLTFEEVANAIGDLQTAVDGKVDRVGDTMTGPLKFKSGSFSGAISGYFNGISFYKLDANDNVILIGSFRDTDLTARNTGTADLGTSSIKWRTLYALKLNNGADLAIPTQGGTLARIEDVPVDISDLSDVQTNNPQVGDYLRWNGQFWYNASGSSGATVNWGQIGGNIVDQPDLQDEFDTKANVDMDNLTDTGANIANWSHNVTNCVAEIPQDIKLELNAGALTVKAGSKIYVPNGVGTFDELTTTNDLTGTGYSNLQGMVFVTTDGNGFWFTGLSQISSGASGTLGSGNVWYDTTNNKIYRSTDGSSWDVEVGFPIALVTCSSGNIVSIDQVFNGFGYIGSTVFAFPGLKVVIPNGRNTNGTLKNIPITLSSVTTYTTNTTGANNVVILSDGSINLAGINYWIYNEHKNTWAHDNNTLAMASIANSNHNTTITSFTPKTVFHAVDYSDIVDDINDESPSKLTTVEWVKNKIMASVLGDLYPVGSIYIGTQGTCPLATLIPGSTWTQIQGRYLLASGTLAGTGETYGANSYVASGAPNIEGGFMAHSGIANPTANGAFWIGSTYGNNGWNGTSTQGRWYGFTAYNSNSTYGQSGAIRAPGYVVNVWRRTS